MDTTQIIDLIVLVKSTILSITDWALSFSVMKWNLVGKLVSKLAGLCLIAVSCGCCWLDQGWLLIVRASEESECRCRGSCERLTAILKESYSYQDCQIDAIKHFCLILSFPIKAILCFVISPNMLTWLRISSFHVYSHHHIKQLNTVCHSLIDSSFI